MSLIFFAQSMFGQLFAIRILRSVRDQALVTPDFLAKIGTAFAAIVAFGPVLLFSSPKYSFILVISALLALRLVVRHQENRARELLLLILPHFVDRWLLNLKTGMSFTRARDSALAATDPRFRGLMAPLLERGSGSPRPRHAFIENRVVDALRRIEATSPLATARLENLRDTLRDASDFRRKSGHALRQARVQGAVLLVLHFALVVFVGRRFGWSAQADLLVGATLWTGLGVLILNFIARRIKWTI